MENLEGNIKKIKHTRILLPPERTITINSSSDDLHKLLPHRSPFLFLDSVQAINLDYQAILGTRYINGNDPVFLGHFPNYPIYPGVLQLEMMAQLGLCLMYFIKHNTEFIRDDRYPVKGLFTKVHYSQFMIPVLPGDHVEILSQLISYDEFLGTVAGQIIKNGEICSVTLAEVYFDE